MIGQHVPPELETFGLGSWNGVPQSKPFPRRALTELEARTVLEIGGAFYDDNYSALDRKLEAVEVLTDSIDHQDKDALDSALAKVTEGEFSVYDLVVYAMQDAIMIALMAGQRMGFRHCMALQAHLQACAPGAKFAGIGLSDDQGHALLNGAAVNDASADVLLGFLAHGGPPALPPELVAGVTALGLPQAVQEGSLCCE